MVHLHMHLDVRASSNDGLEQIAPLVLSPEAVAQTSARSAVRVGGGSGVGDGPGLIGGSTARGAVSGPPGGDLVAVELGEVVGHHQ